jgi:prolyl 4-hydroxylase
MDRYTQTQEFRAHHDWFHPSGHDSSVLYSGNRLSSFFVYLVADCEGGTTAFTEVKRPKAPEWCEALKCQDENGQEVQWLEVQPKVGTAIFWYNLDPETGDGDFLTMHAGMPVSSGTKMGLNIWTRERSYRNPIIPEEYIEEVEVVEEHIVYVDETGQEYVEVHHE